MNHIMMVGAGAVGGFFGAQLARKHSNVSFLLRSRTLEAVQRKGLTIRSASLGTFTIHPPAASDPTELPAPNLIILGVKAYDLDEVCSQIEPVVRDKTIILTLQNGVSVEDDLMNRFGRERVIGGVAFIYSKIVEPGVIEHYKRGAVALGEIMGNETSRLNRIVELFHEAGVSCSISDDIRRAKWEKMCWNCVFNPLTVLLNDRVARALDHSDIQPVISTIVSEVSSVAMAHRIPLDDDIAEQVVQWSQEIRDIHTSMYDDWKAGRQTEIEYLNGYIAKQGKELGIPTPLNESLTALVKAITQQASERPDLLRIHGEVNHPASLDIDALSKLPAECQVPDVSTLMPGARGVGIRVKGLLDLATLHAGASHVTFHSGDGNYSACLTLDQARNHGILVYQVEGAPLSLQKGGPFRLVTPGLGDLCANVKQVTNIEITRSTGKDTRPSQACS